MCEHKALALKKCVSAVLPYGSQRRFWSPQITALTHNMLYSQHRILADKTSPGDKS